MMTLDTQKTRVGIPTISGSDMGDLLRRLRLLTLAEVESTRDMLESEAYCDLAVLQQDQRDHMLSLIDDAIAARPIKSFTDIAIKARAILQRRDLDFDYDNRSASAQMLLQIIDFAARSAALAGAQMDQQTEGDPAIHRTPRP